MTPILEDHFYHDGRGPELHRAVWVLRGTNLVGFEYFNPDDAYEENNLKHLRLEKVEAFAMAGEEVHGNIIFTPGSKAAIHCIEESRWLQTFQQNHLADCMHYQVVFYDEVFDIVCKAIHAGTGAIEQDGA